MKIRDKRNKGWFYIDNEYLNGYARIIGATGVAVYVSLCRHANIETQTCFPSQELISEELNISGNTVRKYLKLLEKYNLISIISEKNEDTKQQLNNVYILLDKTEWVKVEPTSTIECGLPIGPTSTIEKSRPQPLSNKDTNSTKETNIKDTNTLSGKPDKEVRNFKDFIIYYSNQYQQHLEHKYPINWGRDMKLLKDNCSSLTNQELNILADGFFEYRKTADAWCKGKKADIPMFVNQKDNVIVYLKEKRDEIENKKRVERLLK